MTPRTYEIKLFISLIRTRTDCKPNCTNCTTVSQSGHGKRTEPRSLWSPLCHHVWDQVGADGQKPVIPYWVGGRGYIWIMTIQFSLNSQPTTHNTYLSCSNIKLCYKSKDFYFFIENMCVFCLSQAWAILHWSLLYSNVFIHSVLLNLSQALFSFFWQGLE